MALTYCDGECVYSGTEPAVAAADVATVPRGVGLDGNVGERLSAGSPTSKQNSANAYWVLIDAMRASAVR